MAVVDAGIKDGDVGAKSQASPQGQQGQPIAPRAIKLTDMFSQLGSQGGWTGSALEYLEVIRKALGDPSKAVKASMQYISDEAVAFTSVGGNSSIVLVRDNDIVNAQALLADAKFINAKDAFRNAFPKGELINIVNCNRFMFDRPAQMANYISQVLSAQQNDVIAEFNINSFGDRYHVNIDQEMVNVRQFFDNHSPSPVTCGDFGFIASILDKSDTRNLQFQTGIPMFGVTGYVEFIRHEGTGIFTPIVHVTDILSVLPSTKILALALPLIGEVFISRNLWRQPFTAIGKSDINIGNLLIDATTQKPFEVKSDVDFRKLFKDWIGPPVLCIDTKIGHTSIPGIEKITRVTDHAAFANEIFTFLGAPGTTYTEGVGENIFKEIVGVVETAKTAKFANLKDTRDVTYLWAISKLKYFPKLEQLLTRTDADPIRRFDMIREIIQGEVTPTHSSITTLLYGNFMRLIASTVAAKVSVIMPMATELPVIDMSEFVNKAYQPGTVFGSTGVGSMVSSGHVRW